MIKKKKLTSLARPRTVRWDCLRAPGRSKDVSFDPRSIYPPGCKGARKDPTLTGSPRSEKFISGTFE